MSDLIGGLVTNYLNSRNQERSYEQQRELQRDAQQWNEMMWNRSNLYNSPMQQMARFQAAGLNPNLIYGQMANTASSPTMSSGSAPSPAQAPAMSATESAQLSLLNAQKRNIDADTEQKQSDAGLKDRQRLNIDFQEGIQERNQTMQENLANSQISVNEAEVKVYNEQASKLSKETESLGEDVISKRIQNYVDYMSMDDKIALVKASLNKVNAEIRLTNAQATRIATLLDQELKNLQAEFNEINSRTDLNKQQKENMIQSAVIDAADNFYLLSAQELRDYAGKGYPGSNWFEARGVDMKIFGNEMIYLFSHGLGLGKILR